MHVFEAECHTYLGQLIDKPFYGPQRLVVRRRRAPRAELVIEDLVEGDGAEAKAGMQVTVDYAGVDWSDGFEFDASWNRNDTFTFRLGAGEVIAGWDEGVQGMKVGGRRRITIPPDMAYGSRGAGGVIGPDETLIFVVDLRRVHARALHERVEARAQERVAAHVGERPAVASQGGADRVHDQGVPSHGGLPIQGVRGEWGPA